MSSTPSPIPRKRFTLSGVVLVTMAAAVLFFGCAPHLKQTRRVLLPKYLTLYLYNPPELKGFWLVEPRELKDGKYQFGIIRRLNVPRMTDEPI